MKKILVQLDPDSQASLFDAMVACDSDVDHLLQYDDVEPANVRDLVHGAIFTRSPKKLNHTAIFIGGSDVQRGEALLEQVRESFFGPMRVSVMLDSNGANTTAAAAVLAAANHLPLKGVTATVLAGTGPVGQRAARLLVSEGATVRVCSRKAERAEDAISHINSAVSSASGSLVAAETRTEDQLVQAIRDADLVLAAGAAGIRLLSDAALEKATRPKVAIDLNAVDPLGIEAVKVTDRAEVRAGTTCYGAIGVGGLKMDIHRAAIRRLFSSNELVFDAEEIFAIGRELQSNPSS